MLIIKIHVEIILGGFCLYGLTHFQSTELCVIEKLEPHIGSPLTPTYCQFCTCNGEIEK